MAKDPAFLFYSNDFLAGTFTMSNEQVGKYIRLLCLQHQKYELTENDMLNICQTYDTEVFDKFIKVNGKFYNERLRTEADRRKAFSESRRNNRLAAKTYEEHMETDTVTETKDINRKIERKFIPPELQDVIDYFKSKGYLESVAIKAFDYYNEAGWKDSRGKQVKNWKQKMIAVWMKPENKEIEDKGKENEDLPQ